jgi:uracil-DNA glycosylase
MPDDPRAELASIAASLRAYLEWQVDAGTVGFPKGLRGNAPAPASAPAPATASESASASASEPASASESASAFPSAAAPSLARLPMLAREVSTCTKCSLSATRTQTVFSRGNPAAKLCFIGEAPGADEDEQGIPFNILKCRPPANRRPEQEEMATCIPYLHEQLAIVEPRVIVALGNTAASALLDTKVGITKLRGQWKLYRGKTLVMPTYHPSYLLRPSPQQLEAKRQAWEDLQLVMKELGLQRPPVKR